MGSTMSKALTLTLALPIIHAVDLAPSNHRRLAPVPADDTLDEEGRSENYRGFQCNFRLTDTDQYEYHRVMKACQVWAANNQEGEAGTAGEYIIGSPVNPCLPAAAWGDAVSAEHNCPIDLTDVNGDVDKDNSCLSENFTADPVLHNAIEATSCYPEEGNTPNKLGPNGNEDVYADGAGASLTNYRKNVFNCLYDPTHYLPATFQNGGAWDDAANEGQDNHFATYVGRKRHIIEDEDASYDLEDALEALTAPGLFSVAVFGSAGDGENAGLEDRLPVGCWSICDMLGPDQVFVDKATKRLCDLVD